MLGLPAPADQSTHLSDVLDVIDKATKIIAVFIGAGWVYLNYVRGRTFKHRLEPSISGKTIRRKGVLFLSGLAQIKNVGLSKVPIEQRGTAIQIFASVLQHEETGEPRLVSQDVAVLPVFELHGWLEPGEEIEESFLLPVAEDNQAVALRLGLRIVSRHIEWNADAIVEIALEDTNPSKFSSRRA
jgi:hypothetical protein